MKNELLVNKVRDILTGIDLEEHESSDGWWERSGGAAFGKGKLGEVLEAIAGHGVSAVKTETKRIYLTHCSFGKPVYSVLDEHSKSWCDANPDYIYLCTRELPVIDEADVNALALRAAEKSLAEIKKARDAIAAYKVQL